MNTPDLIKKHEAFIKELQETKDERICRGEVGGVMFETRVLHVDRKTEAREDFIDNEPDAFASEVTTIPWSPFKGIKVWYNVWINVSTELRAHDVLAGAKANGRPYEDPYAKPLRWHLSVPEAEDVVRVWKYLRENKIT